MKNIPPCPRSSAVDVVVACESLCSSMCRSHQSNGVIPHSDASPSQPPPSTDYVVSHPFRRGSNMPPWASLLAWTVALALGVFAIDETAERLARQSLVCAPREREGSGARACAHTTTVRSPCPRIDASSRSLPRVRRSAWVRQSHAPFKRIQPWTARARDEACSSRTRSRTRGA